MLQGYPAKLINHLRETGLSAQKASDDGCNGVSNTGLPSDSLHEGLLQLVEQLPECVVPEENRDALCREFCTYQTDAIPPAYDPDDRVDVFWVAMEKVTDPATNQPTYSSLCRLAKHVLLIPHSNAYRESMFSMVKKMATDQRSTLGRGKEGHDTPRPACTRSPMASGTLCDENSTLHSKHRRAGYPDSRHGNIVIGCLLHDKPPSLLNNTRGLVFDAHRWLIVRSGFQIGRITKDSLTFVVFDPPTSITTKIDGVDPDSVVWVEGQTKTVTCEAIGGSPTPIVTLIRDGTELVSGTGSVSRDIAQTRSMNPVVIQCEATNVAIDNPITDQTTINVLYPPSSGPDINGIHRPGTDRRSSADHSHSDVYSGQGQSCTYIDMELPGGLLQYRIKYPCNLYKQEHERSHVYLFWVTVCYWVDRGGLRNLHCAL
ncbi:hypothetical protein ScPMuIL_003180 [Solemya velum]